MAARRQIATRTSRGRDERFTTPVGLLYQTTTDRQTDRRTDGRTEYSPTEQRCHAAHASDHVKRSPAARAAAKHHGSVASDRMGKITK